MGLVVMSAIVAVLVVGAVVQLIIQLLPYRCWRRRSRSAVQARRRPALRPFAPAGTAATAARRYRTHAGAGRRGAPPGGWVFLPVWVGPHRPRRPGPAVIDAEVIEDDHRG